MSQAVDYRATALVRDGHGETFPLTYFGENAAKDEAAVRAAVAREVAAFLNRFPSAGAAAQLEVLSITLDHKVLL